MAKLKGAVSEIHRKTTRVELDPRQLRDLIMEALKRKGLDTSGHVILDYWSAGFRSSSTHICAGPSLSISVEQNLETA
jgi:hypothetical protein